MAMRSAARVAGVVLIATLGACTQSPPRTENAAPVLAPIGARTCVAGRSCSLTVSATDPEGAALVYSASPLPSGATFDVASRIFSWTPTLTQLGSFDVTFSVDDGQLTTSEKVTFTVVASSLPAPQGVTATAGDGVVIVQWAAVSGATSYALYWSTTPGVNVSNATRVDAATSPYEHSGRTNGTRYYYVVTAVDAAGESVPSAEVSASPTASAAVSLWDAIAWDSDVWN